MNDDEPETSPYLDLIMRLLPGFACFAVALLFGIHAPDSRVGQVAFLGAFALGAGFLGLRLLRERHWFAAAYRRMWSPRHWLSEAAHADFLVIAQGVVACALGIDAAVSAVLKLVNC